MINNRVHYKNERRVYDYNSSTKDKISKICTVLYKINDYYARKLIKNNYTLGDIRGTYKYRISKAQFELKNLFIPVFKKLKFNHDLEFLKCAEFKSLSDGCYIFFYLDKKFAKSIKEKGYYFAYQELICNFSGEFDGNICKNFNKKFRTIP